MKSIASELPANKQLNNISILQVKQSMSEIQGAPDKSKHLLILAEHFKISSLVYSCKLNPLIHKKKETEDANKQGVTEFSFVIAILTTKEIWSE